MARWNGSGWQYLKIPAMDDAGFSDPTDITLVGEFNFIAPYNGFTWRYFSREDEILLIFKSKNLTFRRQSLRNNPTNTEYRLWHYIRKKRVNGIRFRRSAQYRSVYRRFFFTETSSGR